MALRGPGEQDVRGRPRPDRAGPTGVELDPAPRESVVARVGGDQPS